LLKQLEVFLARATKLFSVNMTNFEWDKKSVFWMQKTARKCDRDSTKKRARKIGNAKAERQTFTSY